jgi:phosphomannomutase
MHSYNIMVLWPGMFPNHIPNPEDKDAMAAIKKAVLEHGADLGIIFDTDVDRFG